MNVSRNRQKPVTQGEKKLLWRIGFLIALLTLLYIFFAPGRGYFHYRSLKKQVDSLSAENARLASRNTELANEIERLQTDATVQEELARKKHGLLRQNETVYEFNSSRKK